MATEPWPTDDTDVRLTPTMRAYLAAFDEFLLAPTVRERQFARGAMSELCDDMLHEVGLPSRGVGALSAEDGREAA